MKKILTASVLILLLLAALMPCAYAAGESRFVTLNTCTAGDRIMTPITEVYEDAEIIAGYLPSGCTLTKKDGVLYLTGTPMFAGVETFSVNLPTEDILCTMEVQAAVPRVWLLSGDIVVDRGEGLAISVGASVPDAGELSYQWYTDKGLRIVGEVGSTFCPDTGYVGVGGYYCLVTNDNNGRTQSTASDIISVTVTEPEVASISIGALPKVTEFCVGDVPDTTGLRLNVRYRNGSSESVSKGFTVSPSVFALAGRQAVTIDYCGMQTEYSVNVKGDNDGIVGIGVASMPDKTRYKVGDTLDTEGLIIKVYTDNGTQMITEGFEYSPQTFTKAGTQKVTVTFGEKKCSFEVEVEKKVDNTVITVAQMPNRTEYVRGERLDTAGLIIKITDDEGSRIVTDGFSCTPKVLTAAGKQQVRVIYGQYSAEFTVDVKEKENEPSPTPAASAAPTVKPTAPPAVTANVMPTAQPQKTSSGGNVLVKVVVIASVLALASLGGFVYIMQRRGQQ